jgi:hypothetical protein
MVHSTPPLVRVPVPGTGTLPKMEYPYFIGYKVMLTSASEH